MVVEFIDVNYPPFVTAVTTEKLCGKNGAGRSLKNQ